MAVRLRKYQSDRTREAIKVTKLVQFLQETALKGTYLGEEVDPKRINAARIVLAKALPDLKVLDLGNADEEGVKINVNVNHNADS